MKTSAHKKHKNPIVTPALHAALSSFSLDLEAHNHISALSSVQEFLDWLHEIRVTLDGAHYSTLFQRLCAWLELPGTQEALGQDRVFWLWLQSYFADVLAPRIADIDRTSSSSSSSSTTHAHLDLSDVVMMDHAGCLVRLLAGSGSGREHAHKHHTHQHPHPHKYHHNPLHAHNIQELGTYGACQALVSILRCLSVALSQSKTGHAGLSGAGRHTVVLAIQQSLRGLASLCAPQAAHTTHNLLCKLPAPASAPSSSSAAFDALHHCLRASRRDTLTLALALEAIAALASGPKIKRSSHVLRDGWARVWGGRASAEVVRTLVFAANEAWKGEWGVTDASVAGIGGAGGDDGDSTGAAATQHHHHHHTPSPAAYRSVAVAALKALASLSRSSVNAAAIAAADLPTALVTVLYQHHMHTHVVDSGVKLLIRLCHHSLYRRVLLCEAVAVVVETPTRKPLPPTSPDAAAGGAAGDAGGAAAGGAAGGAAAAADGGAAGDTGASVGDEQQKEMQKERAKDDKGEERVLGGGRERRVRVSVTLCDVLLMGFLKGGYVVFPAGSEMACRCLWHLLFDDSTRPREGAATAGGKREVTTPDSTAPPYPSKPLPHAHTPTPPTPPTPTPKSTPNSPSSAEPDTAALSLRLASCYSHFHAAFSVDTVRGPLLRVLKGVEVVQRFRDDGTLPAFLVWD